jgi:hypothetical protein
MTSVRNTLFCALSLAIASCQNDSPKSDGPAAEKEFFVLTESDASSAQLCNSATKVAAIYQVEGDDPAKITQWQSFKKQACQVAENTAQFKANHEAELAKTEALIRANEEAAARMELER